MVLELTQRPGESFPITDPGIPTLPAVLDPIALGARLSAFLPSPPPGSQEVHVRVLRHHAGNRCVVEVTWRRGNESLSLIGKVYARDRSDVYRVMEEIRRAGLGPHEEFSIPQPTAYLPALQLLLQEKVQGRPATESFLSNDQSERATAAERCASWLAEFHAVAPRIGPGFDLHRHLLSMELWARRLAGLGEPFAEKAGKLFKRLQRAASELPSSPEPCTIHGDYSHHQVILAPGRTVTVDWDRYGLADPSHDVARFAVGLQRLALRRLGSMRALDGPADVFLKSYVGVAPWDPSTHLAFHRAAICLEHAKHDVRKQASGWPERAAAALDEGLRVVAQGT
jgi:aminoglycoside phosphotransferase (APT) family kinase protein